MSAEIHDDLVREMRQLCNKTAWEIAGRRDEMPRISRNKYFDDIQMMKDALKAREIRDQELLVLKLRLDMLEQIVNELRQEVEHEKRIDELAKGAEEYLEEHYDGEEKL